MTLLELADACERAKGADRGLNREIALAVGWHRYTPSELGRSNPGWIAPEDFTGETISKDGRKRPILDSLHGTDVWREPRDFTGSLDAAMQLVQPEWGYEQKRSSGPDSQQHHVIIWWVPRFPGRVHGSGATPALALASAALRARHAMESE